MGKLFDRQKVFKKIYLIPPVFYGQIEFLGLGRQIQFEQKTQFLNRFGP